MCPAAGPAKRREQKQIDKFTRDSDSYRAQNDAAESCPALRRRRRKRLSFHHFSARNARPAPDRRRPRPTGRYQAGNGGACRAPGTKAPRTALRAHAVVGAGTGPRVFRRDRPASRMSLPEFPQIASPDPSPRRRCEAEMYDAATDRASPTWGRSEGNLRCVSANEASSGFLTPRSGTRRFARSSAGSPRVSARARPKGMRFRNQLGARSPASS